MGTYIPNSHKEQQEMLKICGFNDFADMFTKNHSFSYERSFINRFSTNRKIKKSQYPNSQYSIFHVAEFL